MNPTKHHLAELYSMDWLTHLHSFNFNFVDNLLTPFVSSKLIKAMWREKGNSTWYGGHMWAEELDSISHVARSTGRSLK